MVSFLQFLSPEFWNPLMEEKREKKKKKHSKKCWPESHTNSSWKKMLQIFKMFQSINLGEKNYFLVKEQNSLCLYSILDGKIPVTHIKIKSCENKLRGSLFSLNFIDRNNFWVLFGDAGWVSVGPWLVTWGELHSTIFPGTPFSIFPLVFSPGLFSKRLPVWGKNFFSAHTYCFFAVITPPLA